MRRERWYEASADNGRDYFTFEFKSEHRANSKANKEDANREYKRSHGHGVKILSTQLKNYW